jgi:hypothetical protein
MQRRPLSDTFKNVPGFFSSIFKTRLIAASIKTFGNVRKAGLWKDKNAAPFRSRGYLS